MNKTAQYTLDEEMNEKITKRNLIRLSLCCWMKPAHRENSRN